MRLAVIIGNGCYRSLNDLPACSRDGRTVNKVISAAGKYDRILYLCDDECCREAQEKLRTFLAPEANGKVEELLFYYSGHGDFDGKEYWYLWGDYAKERREETALCNSRIDSWIRNLAPEMTVKIIDACESGISYVLDRNSLPSLSDGRDLKKCYFLFSSREDENAYSSRDGLSYFTHSLLRTLKNGQDGPVGFREVLEGVASDFENEERQNPFFVIQAELNEVFLELKPQVREVLEDCVPDQLSLP